MTFILELPDADGRYAELATTDLPKALVRDYIGQLGIALARTVRDCRTDAGDRARRVLCVIILRGGALLYPAFAVEFDDADFCMLGLRRGRRGVVADYRTAIPRRSYERIVYIDCVAATGGTIFAARRAVAQQCTTDEEISAVICGARTATRALYGAGVSVVGFSLDEAEANGIVGPDLGRLDAGDLFTTTGDPPAGARRSPDAFTFHTPRT